ADCGAYAGILPRHGRGGDCASRRTGARALAAARRDGDPPPWTDCAGRGHRAGGDGVEPSRGGVRCRRISHGLPEDAGAILEAGREDFGNGVGRRQGGGRFRRRTLVRAIAAAARSREVMRLGLVTARLISPLPPAGCETSVQWGAACSYATRQGIRWRYKVPYLMLRLWPGRGPCEIHLTCYVLRRGNSLTALLRSIALRSASDRPSASKFFTLTAIDT